MKFSCYLFQRSKQIVSAITVKQTVAELQREEKRKGRLKMIFDLHLHTRQYSDDSFIDIEEAVERALEMGMNGLCITDHESNGAREMIDYLSKKYNCLIIVGVEILTYEGDIVCYGLDELPAEKLHAKELIEIVNKRGGVSISAHPYRTNNRGMEDNLYTIEGLAGVEVLNGSTIEENNCKALIAAQKRGFSCVGASDAHVMEKIGKFATKFTSAIRSEKDLIDAVKNGACHPVRYDKQLHKFIDALPVLSEVLA